MYQTIVKHRAKGFAQQPNSVIDRLVRQTTREDSRGSGERTRAGAGAECEQKRAPIALKRPGQHIRGLNKYEWNFLFS